MKLILSAFLLLAMLFPLALAETSGTINNSGNSVNNTVAVTGLLGYTINNCTASTDCLGYSCFLVFDSLGRYSSSLGICNATYVTSCIHDASGGTFSVAADTNFYCTANTTYRQCLSGAWASSTSCAAGQTCNVDSISSSNPCAAPAATTTTTSGGSGSGTTTAQKVTLKLRDVLTEIRIIQNTSKIIYIDVL